MTDRSPKPDQSPLPESRLSLGDVTVDLHRRKVLRGDSEDSLTSIEAKLLSYLAGRVGEVVTKADLYTDVWAYSATTISRAAEKAIVRLRKKIEARPDDPEYLLTVWGEGWCFRVDGGMGSVATSQPTSNVPSETKVVVPRPESELVDAELRGPRRLVTLTGPGGMGKTTLALGLARVANQEGRYGGGVWWIDLCEAQSGTDVVLAVASSLGHRIQGTDLVADVAEIGLLLAGRGSSLLVFDNCEQVVEPAAEMLSAWLEAAPGLQGLATSRVRLRLGAELAVPVAPLDVAASVALFIQRAWASGAVVEDSNPALPVLAERLAGLPLAIEIAAAHVSLLGPEALTRRLDERLIDLDTRQRDSKERHKSLEACLSISWELLDSDARSVLALSSLFRSGFTLEAAENILADAVVDREVYEVIQGLVDHSLLWVCPAGDAMRLQLLVTTRSFAARRCASLSEQDSTFASLVASTKRAHVRWYGRLGTPDFVADQQDSQSLQQLRALGDDLGNLCVAVDYGVELGEAVAAVGAFLVGVPGLFLSARGLEQSIEIGTRLRESLDIEPDLLACLLRDLGRAYWRLSRPSDAQRVARELLELVEAGHASFLRTQAFILMSTVEWGDTERSERWLLRARDEAQSSGFVHRLPHIFADLGSLYGRSARWEEADGVLSQGLVLAERLDDLVARSGLLYQRGDVNRARGQLGAALEDFEAALFLYQRRGNLSRAALLSHSIAAVHVLCGRPEEAAVLLQRVLDEEPLATPRRTANRARITMALCLLDEGAAGYGKAEQLIGQLVSDDVSEPSPWIRAPALLVQLDIDLARGDLPASERHLEHYISLYQELQSLEFTAFGRGALALVRARQGRRDEAEELLAEALDGWPESCPYEYAILLCRAAEVRALVGQSDAARDALKDARQLLSEMAVGPRSPLGRAVADAERAVDS